MNRLYSASSKIASAKSFSAPKSFTPTFTSKTFNVSKSIKVSPVTQERAIFTRNWFKARPSAKELADKTGIPEELIKDPHLHLVMIKVGALFDKLNIMDSKEREKFLDEYTISPGYRSMEWIFQQHGAPPPHHTHEELPIIKEIEGGASPAH